MLVHVRLKLWAHAQGSRPYTQVPGQNPVSLFFNALRRQRCQMGGPSRQNLPAWAVFTGQILPSPARFAAPLPPTAPFCLEEKKAGEVKKNRATRRPVGGYD